MSDPWLTIVGLGEDGPSGLSAASLDAIARAEKIFGGPRHLALIGAADRGHPWPVPFDLAPVLACRGQKVVVLASGDPFCYGAGGSLMAHLAAEEWVSHPAPSTFSLAANSLGWRLEELRCIGLHAAPYARLRPMVGRGARMICLLRDAAAVSELADWLVANGQDHADLFVMERLGGPHARIRQTRADAPALTEIAAPVTVAVQCHQSGLSGASGLPNDVFAHDGQITKRPVRALTLSALAPRSGEVMWDLGAGSGSIGIEWLLAGGGTCHAVEADSARAARALGNAAAFGLAHRYQMHEGAARAVIDTLPAPDTVFIGGGAEAALITALCTRLPAGVRLVVNAVTLEAEALLAQSAAQYGGSLMRVEIAEAHPLGRKRGWRASYPIVQWVVTV